MKYVPPGQQAAAQWRLGIGATGAKATLVWLAVALVLSMTPWFSATAVIPALRVKWALSSGVAAWVTIAVQVGFVAGALASSLTNISDLVAPRRLFVIGSIAAAAANLALLGAHSVATAIPLRMLTGAGLALVYPPALKLLATWFRTNRGFALGAATGAITLGSALPHLINGLGGLDWHVVVDVTSVLGALGAVIVALGVQEGPFPFPRATFDARQARRAFRSKGVALATLGYLGHMWELYAVWAWFGVFFGAVLHRSNESGATRAAAFATFAVIAAGAAGCIFAGVVSDTRGRARTNAILLLVSGTCAVSIGLMSELSPWWVLAVGVIWGGAVVGDSAQFSTLVTEYADQAYVGTALGLQLALGFALTVPSIWLVRFLAHAIGWRYAFAPLAVGPIVGVVAMVRLARHERRGRVVTVSDLDT